MLTRREFVLSSASAAALAAAQPDKSRVGLVQSTHKSLARPASADDPLDYGQVRDMVWKAIEYGKPRAGSLEAKIRPGSWVVVKPNLVFLRPQSGYSTGDITDLRVLKAVLEYVARKSRASRITLAEGGSYRGLKDPAADNCVQQNGARADAVTFDWGDQEYPGFAGSLGAMLKEFNAEFGKRFDYVDLNYDAVRNASGKPARIEVPRTRRGVGAFGGRPDYYVTNTIRNCDFLIVVPVMKIHEQCGITACFKSYVGTAPREAYAAPGQFWNVLLHKEHSLDGRIDPFIADLAAFHPPDYSVVDGIRGLQFVEHYHKLPGQMLRNNLVLAGEDPVANDSVVAKLMGFNPWDIEFLHLAEQREIGTRDFRRIEVTGDDPESLRRRWGKPRRWYGRCNREWTITQDPSANLGAWKRYTSPTDTLDFNAALGTAGAAAGAAACGAAVKVYSDGARKAFLWAGAQGRITALLNGEKVLEEENMTAYRVGQFQKAVELRSGENLLVFRAQGAASAPRLSALLVGARNDGDSVEGIRWSA